MDFNQRPMLVFWESTRACLLACRHCRAEAVEKPAPGELSTAEAVNFIEGLTRFGRPYPVLIFTGGDALMRPDIFELAARARELGIPVGMSPSVTPRLTDENIAAMAELGVRSVSISLDGASAAVHERIRGVEGHFGQTVRALKRLVAAGFQVQVNTTAMRGNAAELPALVQVLKETGVGIWEVFFLIPVGRGQREEELSPSECEDVSHFLFEASLYGLTVRTVEAPFFRRVALWRKDRGLPSNTGGSGIREAFGLGPLYEALSEDLRARFGDPKPDSASRVQTGGTRDGSGIVFVSYDGTVYPAGFLPLALGNVRSRPLTEIYRGHPLLRDIREARFHGRCGVCEYRSVCGGSRSRAYALKGDALAEDPACVYSSG